MRAPTRGRYHSPYRRKEEPPAKPVGNFLLCAFSLYDLNIDYILGTSKVI